MTKKDLSLVLVDALGKHVTSSIYLIIKYLQHVLSGYRNNHTTHCTTKIPHFSISRVHHHPHHVCDGVAILFDTLLLQPLIIVTVTSHYFCRFYWVFVLAHQKDIAGRVHFL